MAKSLNCGHGTRTEYAVNLGSNRILKLRVMGSLRTVGVHVVARGQDHTTSTQPHEPAPGLWPNASGRKQNQPGGFYRRRPLEAANSGLWPGSTELLMFSHGNLLVQNI